jgi:8-oxo-dGTP diphosphatase
MNPQVSPDFYNPNHTFMGCNALILFGEANDQALSYIRDGNTDSYPYRVDFAGGKREDGESPFDTLRRETIEEFGIDIRDARIEYTAQYTSLLNPSFLGWFAVARAKQSLAAEVKFGDEGLCEHISSLHELSEHPLLIPRRREQIQDYLTHTQVDVPI